MNKQFNYMTYQQLCDDIPALHPLIKPYTPLNDDSIRGIVINYLLSIGFVFPEDVPEIKTHIRKRGAKYYLDEFGIEYKRIKGEK